MRSIFSLKEVSKLRMLSTLRLRDLGYIAFASNGRFWLIFENFVEDTPTLHVKFFEPSTRFAFHFVIFSVPWFTTLLTEAATRGVL